MIHIKDNSIIITIATSAPLEQLLLFKKSLNRVLRFIDADTVDSNSGLIYDMQNVIDLASELEFESEQMQQITNALQSKKTATDQLYIK
ncbi:hypothetical protein [Mucilaginibacter sp.]